MSILFRKTEVIVFKSSILGKEKAYKAESAIYDLKMTFTFLQYTSQNLKVRKRAELCIAEGGGTSNINWKRKFLQKLIEKMYVLQHTDCHFKWIVKSNQMNC